MSPEMRNTGWVRTWLLLLLPAFCALAVVLVASTSPRQGPPAPAPTEGSRPAGRLLVVVVDALRPENLRPEEMPRLAARAAAANVRPVRTCAANFTLPCIQTLLEGRESPFAAGLQNFTGAEGGEANFVETLGAWGGAAVLISDHTLESLYGRSALRVYDAEDWPPGHLERDLRAIEVADDELSRSDVDVVILHIVGTDKIAHKARPGAADYARHFAAVDDALDALLGEHFDPRQDHVIVTGDHGHGPLGHHTRESVAVFLGDGFDELFAGAEIPPLAQTDLLYFLSWATTVPVPIGRDVRYFPATRQTSRSLAFDRLHASVLTGGIESVSAAFDADREARERRKGDPIWRSLPFVVLGAIATAIGLGLAMGRAPTGAPLLLVGLAVGALAVAAAPLGALGSVGLSVALILVWTRFARHAVDEQSVIPWLVVFFLAAAAGALAEPWAEFFHTHGGFRPSQLVFYCSWPVVALGASRLLFGHARWAPEAAMLVGAAVVPAGVYYYQQGQNFFTGFVITGAVLGAVHLARTRRIPPAAELAAGAVLTSGMVYVMLQESGGWEWHFFPHVWIERLGAAVWVGYAVVGALVVAVLRDRWRWAVALAWVLFPAFVVGAAELAPARWVAAALVVPIFLAHARIRCEAPEPIAAVFLYVASLYVAWTLSDGFFLFNVDFQFALEWFADLEHERDVYALTQVATNLKYGLSFVLLWLAARAAYGRERFRRVAGASLVLSFVVVVCQMLQAVWGRPFQEAQLHELAAGNLLFIVNIGLIIAVTAIAIELADHLAERALSDQQPEDAEEDVQRDP